MFKFNIEDLLNINILCEFKYEAKIINDYIIIIKNCIINIIFLYMIVT